MVTSAMKDGRIIKYTPSISFQHTDTLGLASLLVIIDFAIFSHPDLINIFLKYSGIKLAFCRTFKFDNQTINKHFTDTFVKHIV